VSASGAPATPKGFVKDGRSLHHPPPEPAEIVLSRQAAPSFARTKSAPASGVAKGGYILGDAAGGKPEVIMIGTGTELSLCVAAYEQLTAEGVKARVVSMPSWDIFEKQSESYKNEVLPPSVKARVAVEAGSTVGWSRYVGDYGSVIGMRTFGASAPAKDLFKKFGFTIENVIGTARATMARAK